MPEDVLRTMLSIVQLLEQELLYFAAFWFVLGALDEFAVDCVWLFLRLFRKQAEKPCAARPDPRAIAVFIAAWKESQVIGHTIGHALRVWPQRDLRLYVGCYGNDPATVAAAMAGAGDDPRLRIVIHDRPGPTTKADCLNRVYRAMCADEARERRRFAGVVMHDAEDMVHPDAIAVIAAGLADADFVQLPVLPEPQPSSPWIAGHYSDEFAEAHGKTLVVRDALGAPIPAAGVGCGFGRQRLGSLATAREAEGGNGPFASECLTEDYELGLLFSHGGGRSRFLRERDADGRLVATRAYFPATLETAVRQKTRWIHGIALQGWDRLGWSRRPVDVWMRLRDRRGPLMAVVLAAAYAWLCLTGVLFVAKLAGLVVPARTSPGLQIMLWVCLASMLWRIAMRLAFTAREYGLAEGLRSIPRMFVANIIAIMAGRRALVSYMRTLRGAAVVWDKTEHSHHPATLQAAA
ncbi:adsorption protein B [Novosphingobium chloroacetimidivorans]|uniref:Adsorption protein B n=1 Tax=Novosphingobium chloroacetimidivorans TaxID=1428314 RepID=A0A7W7KBP8_9SPHN|nr:glycosyl transferase family protein [Novosphingobium chloroacetimidivorans]MBB4859874.1 adsorption protein B [Novosphingobium chloroacetimidivorans]